MHNMSKTYTQVTILDPYGHTFKITCYPRLHPLLQQIEHHYNELCKTQFCKDNNIDRRDLNKYEFEYLSARLHAKASLFSPGNTVLCFENEFLNVDNYDRAVMMDDDVIELHRCYNPDKYDVDVILELSCDETEISQPRRALA